MSDGPRLILLGAGGHAKVVLALASAAGLTVDAVSDACLAGQGAGSWRGLPVMGDDVDVSRLDPAGVLLINGLGQIPGLQRRAQLYAHFCQLGFAFPVLVHPAAWVAPGVVLEPGVQIMAGVVVQPDVSIGANSVINTSASIDHDCVIGSDVHVAPGAVLCGGVVVHRGSFIGSGATVAPGIIVGAAAVVGAGAVLLRDLAPAAVWRPAAGVPGALRR